MTFDMFVAARFFRGKQAQFHYPLLHMEMLPQSQCSRIRDGYIIRSRCPSVRSQYTPKVVATSA